MLRITFLAILIAWSTIAMSQETFPEPFGLKWGMSEASLKKLGFTKGQDLEGFKLFVSLSVPKAWSKGDKYAAITYKGKLVKVAATSTEFTNDIYGDKGKQLYQELKKLLTKKYGAPKTDIEQIGGKLYKDADEFYQCLKYAGCGYYVSYFDYRNGAIAIQLEGRARGEGFLRISYESPAFSTAKDEIDKGSLVTDEDAL